MANDRARDAGRSRADTSAGGSAEPPTDRPPSNADAVVTMAESLLANGAASRSAGERHEVVVHVDVASLDSGSVRRRGALTCCELENGPAISAETARRLSCDASVVSMLESPDGTLHVGRRTRAIPPSIRRALRSRDRGCRFPGCTNHRWVDGHHIRHWGAGGETELDNLVQLCRRHHRLVHEEGFNLERKPDGALVFHRPDGTPIPSAPTVGPADADSRNRPSTASEVPEPIPLPIGAGEPMDLHLTVSGLMERLRPEGPNGRLLLSR